MYLRSPYEQVYAQYLDSQRLTWYYQPDRFLDWDGIHHKLPDFYVEEYKSYVEIKPMWRMQEASDLKRLLVLKYKVELLVVDGSDLDHLDE